MSHDSPGEQNESSPGIYDLDRQQGIFTPRDRRFMLGMLDDELSDDAKRQKRYRLRKRTLHALQDLHYTEEFSQTDTNALKTSIYEDNDVSDRVGFGVGALLEFLYDLYGGESFVNLFEDTVEWEKTKQYYLETGNYAKFTVDVIVNMEDPIMIEELAEQSAERELTPFQKIFVKNTEEGQSAYEPHSPELVSLVLDVAAELTDDIGADWGEVCDRVMDQADADRTEVTQAMEDAVLTGKAEAPTGRGTFRVLDSESENSSSVQ